MVKRIRKYFNGRESLFVPAMFDSEDMMNDTNDELLRTIKLSKKCFQAELAAGDVRGPSPQLPNNPRIDRLAAKA